MLTDDFYYKSRQKFALSTKVNAVYHRSTRGSLGVRRLPLLGAEEAPQEHAPRHKLQTSKVCLVTQKIQTVGFVHFWYDVSGKRREKTFGHAFFHLAIRKSGEKLLECSFAGLPRLIALLFVRLGAADLRKKKRFYFQLIFLCKILVFLNLLALSRKKRDKNTKKKKHIKEFCCK